MYTGKKTCVDEMRLHCLVTEEMGRKKENTRQESNKFPKVHFGWNQKAPGPDQCVYLRTSGHGLER